MSHELMHTLGYGHGIKNFDTLSSYAKWARNPVINRWHSDLSTLADRKSYRKILKDNVYVYENSLNGK